MLKNVDLLKPEVLTISENIIRPELQLFNFQNSLYQLQEKQLKTEYIPRVNAFFQGAYGRPTLNMFENKFGPWFVTGLRFSWQLGSLYTLNNKKEILALNKLSVKADKETFLLNTNLELIQQKENAKKYQDLLQKDDEVIELRSSVTQSANEQLANGVITVHEYIQKLNAEDLAKQNKLLHEILLLQALYNQKFISGN